MSRHKYMGEFELKASPKMIFSYLVNPAGLAQWFADNVSTDDYRTFNFIWDNSPHYARIASMRTNKYVKFEFLSDDQKEKMDPPYIEFKLDMNELTQSSFLKVTDYSDMDDEDDLKELWTHMVASLRETVGG